MPKKLSDFRLASEEEINEASKLSNGLIGGAIFPWGPGGFHRTIIYKVMDETFGSPNYYPGEKSTWEWVIYTKAGLLTVYDYKGLWSIGYLYTKPSEELRAEATIFRDALFEEAKKVKISKKQIKKGKIGGAIRNPYSIYRRTTGDLMNQAYKVVEEIYKIRSEKDFLKSVNGINLGIVVGSLYRAAFMSNFLSLEGFINLIYKLFLRERYRKEIYEKRLRGEMLPIKILEIDTYCHSFENPPLTEKDELFSATQHFINIRNQFLHANICEPMESHYVKLDKHNVVVESEVKEKYGITSDLNKLTNIHIIRAEKLVEKIVLKILQSLVEKIKLPFATIHSYIWINYIWNKKDSIIFLLDEEDFQAAEIVEVLLEEPTELNEEYYNVEDKEFKPTLL